MKVQARMKKLTFARICDLPANSETWACRAWLAAEAQIRVVRLRIVPDVLSASEEPKNPPRKLLDQKQRLRNLWRSLKRTKTAPSLYLFCRTESSEALNRGWMGAKARESNTDAPHLRLD